MPYSDLFQVISSIEAEFNILYHRIILNYIESQVVKFTINFFDVEDQENCDYDKLTIRDDGNEARI